MDLTQGIVLKVSTEGTVEVTKLTDELKKAGDAARGLGDGSKKASKDAADAFKDMAKEAGKAALEVLGLYEVFGKIKEGLRFADEVNDMKASIDALSGTTGTGAKALDYFEKSSQNVKATTMQLAGVFRDDLPLAMQRGFSPDQFQKFTVTLANFAAATGKSLDEVKGGYEALLAGKVRANNPILESLKDVPIEAAKAAGGLQLVTDAIEKTSKRGEEMGLSFDDVMAKVKDSIGLSFAKGFESAQKDAESGFNTVLKIINDPAIQKAINNIGSGIAQIMPYVARVIEGAVGVLYIAIGGVEEFFFNVAAKIAQGIGFLLEKISAGANKIGLSSLSDKLDSASSGYRGAQYMFESLGEDAHQKGQQGYTMLGSAITGYNGEAAKAADTTKKLNLHLKDNAALSEEAAKKAQKLADEYTKQTRHAEDVEAAFKKFGEIKTLDPITAKFREIDDAAAKLSTDMGRTIDDLKKAESGDSDKTRIAGYEKQIDLLKKMQEELPKVVQKQKDAVVSNIEQTKALQDYNSELSLYDSKLKSGLSGVAEPISTPVLLQLQKLQEAAAKNLVALKDANKLTPDAAEDIINTFVKAGQELVKGGRLSGEAFNKAIAVQQGLKNIFMDIFESGGKNFGSVVASMLSNFSAGWMNDMSNKASNGLLKGLDSIFGKKGTTTVKDGQEVYVPSSTTQTVIAGASALYGLYDAGQHGVGKGTNAIMGAAQGAQIGMVGGVPGAVIGAVVGALAGYLTGHDKQADYQYGIPGIDKNGTAYFGKTKNIPDALQKQIQGQVQSIFDSVWNAYVNVLLKLPGSKLPNLSAIDGKFQDNPSGHFMEHLQQWLTKTLPDSIAAEFKDSMSQVFTRSGMTQDAFTKFWEEAKGLDAQAGAKFWSDMADGISSFANAAQQFNDAKNSSLGDSFIGGKKRLSSDNDFTANLKASTQGIFDQARAMVSLTGPDRVAAFAALGNSVEQVTKSLQQYITEIAGVLKNLKSSFDSARVDHDYSRITDPNEQARFLEDQYNKIVYQIQNASGLGLNPSDVQNLSQQGLQLLNQIYSLDPTKAADEWWHQQVDTLQQFSTDALQHMKDYAESQVSTLLDELKPFKDWFLGLPTDLDAAYQKIPGAFDGFAQALDDLTTRIHNTLTTPSTPPSGGGGGAGGGGGDQTPNNTANSINGTTESVTVNVNMPNGTVIGVDDFTAHISDAVITTIQRNPRLIEASF
jgi:hypothetical protein